MRIFIAVLFIVTSVSAQAHSSEDGWYTGDERCHPPKNDGTYSAPYNALEHPKEYPTFNGADIHGWSCSYQRDDGVTVQFGDSRTPQEQWQSVWGGDDNT
jgi:hypothetical protein